MCGARNYQFRHQIRWRAGHATRVCPMRSQFPWRNLQTTRSIRTKRSCSGAKVRGQRRGHQSIAGIGLRQSGPKPVIEGPVHAVGPPELADAGRRHQLSWARDKWQPLPKKLFRHVRPGSRAWVRDVVWALHRRSGPQRSGEFCLVARQPACDRRLSLSSTVAGWPGYHGPRFHHDPWSPECSGILPRVALDENEICVPPRLQCGR
jgi:hypothetical protein